MFSETTINNFLNLFGVASFLKCFPFYWDKRENKFRLLESWKLKQWRYSAWVHLCFGLYLECVLIYNIRELYLSKELSIPGLISEVSLTCSFLAHACCNITNLIYGEDVLCRLRLQIGLNTNWRKLFMNGIFASIMAKILLLGFWVFLHMFLLI